MGVTEPGTLFEVPVDLTDRRVDVDHQRRVARSGTRSPGPLQRVADHRFHLPAMPERERSQERPDRRWGHHPMTQHRPCRPGAEDVGVIDVRRAHAHRMRQRQHLAPGPGTTDTAVEAHRGVDHRLQTKPFRQRRDQHQPGVRDQVRVIEGGVDPVERMRYSRH